MAPYKPKYNYSKKVHRRAPEFIEYEKQRLATEDAQFRTRMGFDTFADMKRVDSKRRQTKVAQSMRRGMRINQKWPIEPPASLAAHTITQALRANYNRNHHRFNEAQRRRKDKPEKMTKLRLKYSHGPETKVWGKYKWQKKPSYNLNW